MRWSQLICLITLLLGVAVGEVLARSDDQWTRIIARSPGVTKPKKISASSLKSSNYRQTAIQQGNIYDPSKKQVVQTSLNKASATGQHADHVLEAQTAARILEEEGIQPSTSQREAVKKVINDSENLTMVNPAGNMDKGRFVRKFLRWGKKTQKPKLNSGTKDYMEATGNQAKKTAFKLDKIFNRPIFSKKQKQITEAAKQASTN